MALADTLSELAPSAVARANRVDLLLDKLGASEDAMTLRYALINRNLSAATITKAINKEYGAGTVKDKSVSDWRRKHLTEVNGL